MRLKYFLRGLGSGIVLTALVTAAAKPQMSDARIVERAKELGMISEEESGVNEKDLSDLSADDDNEEDQDEEDHNDKDREKSSHKDDKSGNTVEEDTKNENSQDDAKEDATGNDDSYKDDIIIDTKETDKKKDGQNIQITINSGLHSYDVSKILEAAGVVDDAKKFDEYLIQYGYQRRIIPGIYEISEKDSYRTIADLITR